MPSNNKKRINILSDYYDLYVPNFVQLANWTKGTNRSLADWIFVPKLERFHCKICWIAPTVTILLFDCFAQRILLRSPEILNSINVFSHLVTELNDFLLVFKWWYTMPMENYKLFNFFYFFELTMTMREKPTRNPSVQHIESQSFRRRHCRSWETLCAGYGTYKFSHDYTKQEQIGLRAFCWTNNNNH